MENLYFFEKYSTNTDTHTCMITQSYEHMHIHSTHMSISKILSWFDFDIHRVDHQERITVRAVRKVISESPDRETNPICALIGGACRVWQ
jgi:hypothetical protein